MKRINMKAFALSALAVVSAMTLAITPAQFASAATIDCTERTVIGYGNAGPCVRDAQALFNAMAAEKGWTGNGYAGGYIIAVDGIYGSNTRNQAYAAQRWFNSWHTSKVSVDGVIGPQTWGILCSYAYNNNLTGYYAQQAQYYGARVCYHW